MSQELITVDAKMVRQIAAEWKASNGTSNVGQQLFLLVGTSEAGIDPSRRACAKIASDEYAYWRPRFDSEKWDGEATGAVSAAANIFAAIFGQNPSKDDALPLDTVQRRALAAETAIVGGALEKLLLDAASQIEMLESALISSSAQEDQGTVGSADTYREGFYDVAKQWDNFVFRLRDLLQMPPAAEPFPRPHIQGVELTA